MYQHRVTFRMLFKFIVPISWLKKKIHIVGQLKFSLMFAFINSFTILVV